jgi:hypothetical protein
MLHYLSNFVNYSHFLMDVVTMLSIATQGSGNWKKNDIHTARNSRRVR